MKRLLIVSLLSTLLFACADKKSKDDPFSHVNAQQVQPKNIEYVLN